MRGPRTRENPCTLDRDDEGARRCRHLGRREFVLAGGAAGLTALAGCMGEQPTPRPPDPVALGGTKQCEVCGMVIDEHPGPTGQIFYRDHTPSPHENPAWFDALQACLFPYYFEHERRGWRADGVYVTDYSVVDYEVRTVEGQQYITVATAPESFAAAGEVTFVARSDVHGAMGPDFHPFSVAGDAEAFADEYGGETMTMEDITPETLV
jgi:copper chaperone NosL